LRPPAVSHPENLVRLIEVHPNDFVTWDLPYKLCDALAAKDASVSEAICQGQTDVAFSDGTSTERVRVHLVSPNFFSSLGVHAYLGRVLDGDDERAAAPNAVLSYAFWQRRFRGDTSILGRGIALGGHPFTIVGVSPEAFNGLANRCHIRFVVDRAGSSHRGASGDVSGGADRSGLGAALGIVCHANLTV